MSEVLNAFLWQPLNYVRKMYFFRSSPELGNNLLSSEFHNSVVLIYVNIAVMCCVSVILLTDVIQTPVFA